MSFPDVCIETVHIDII